MKSTYNFKLKSSIALGTAVVFSNATAKVHSAEYTRFPDKFCGIFDASLLQIFTYSR
jgi:hypothetical protein